MAIEDMDKEQLKDLMCAWQMISANMENWKYVQHNSHLVKREQLEQTVDQMINMFAPFLEYAQMILELEALTKLDPYDLI